MGSSTPKVIAGASRFAVRTFVSPSVADDPEVYVKWIAELTAVEKIEGLFWTTSASTLAIDCFRHYLDASLLRDLSSTDVVHLAYDKAKTFQLAEEAGVGIPTTRTWDSEAELGQIAESVTYPCIIKPRQSCDFQDGRIVNCGQHQYI